jgi:hypothetical protein
MSDERKTQLIKEFENFRDEVISSKKKAIEFLKNAGIRTSTGELTKEYKQ